MIYNTIFYYAKSFKGDLFVFRYKMECDRPKIYDCFMLFDEMELLRIRFEELYDFVDYFVIVEARTKYNGDRKPLYFKKHEAEFEKFKDKIIYIPVSHPKSNLDRKSVV